MNLNEALKKIAVDYNLDADKLIAYAEEDTIGGYHSNPALSKWPMGSMWEVELQTIYALIRATKPKQVLEFGSYHGCSTKHICEAIIKNGAGKLTSIDIAPAVTLPTKYKSVLTQVRKDLFEYDFPLRPKVDFVIEDAMHTADMCEDVWGNFADRAKAGAFIVSHDAEHFIVGDIVKQGIGRVTSEFTSYLIDPGECGLAIWRKP